MCWKSAALVQTGYICNYPSFWGCGFNIYLAVALGVGE
jgi:hypothetical protein